MVDPPGLLCVLPGSYFRVGRSRSFELEAGVRFQYGGYEKAAVAVQVT